MPEWIVPFEWTIDLQPLLFEVYEEVAPFDAGLSVLAYLKQDRAERAAEILGSSVVHISELSPMQLYTGITLGIE